MKEVRNINMKPAEDSLKRNLQHAQFRDMKLNPVSRNGADGSDQLDRQGNKLLPIAVEVDLISVAREADVFQGGVHDGSRIEELVEIAHVGANHASFDVE